MGGVAWTPSRVGAFVLFCPLHLNSTDPPFVEPREAPFNLTVTNSEKKGCRSGACPGEGTR